jgi:hypothetical protein
VGLALGDGVGVLSGSVVCCAGNVTGGATSGMARTGAAVVRRTCGRTWVGAGTGGRIAEGAEPSAGAGAAGAATGPS